MMSKAKCYNRILIFGSVLALSVLGVAAQLATATLTGKVSDASGAVVPGVEVTATHIATNTSRTTITSDSGTYRIPSLAPGQYTVKAALKGFKTAANEGVTLSVGQVGEVHLTLTVGEITEVVTVTGEVMAVDTTQGRVSNLVDERKIVEMPLNGRNVYQLMQLAPGAVNTTATNFEPGQGTSVNGGRVNYNGFWLDGVSSKGLSGGTNIQPSVDTIQEFRMETMNFSAEFGNSAGSVVNVVSKTGTNNFHGTVYEFLRNDNLDAREFFDTKIPEFKQNQFGATVGGPIKKNSTFFFASYEGLRARTGESAVDTFESPKWASFVTRFGSPVAKFLYGNFAAPAITTTTDTVGSYLVGIGEITTATQANVDARLRQIFNAPAGSLLVGDPMVGETSFFSPDFTNANQFSTRIDQEMRGGKDKLFGRYYWDKNEGPVTRPRTQFNSPSIGKAHQVALAETHIFSPTVVNEFRAGLNRGILDILAGTPGVPLIADGGTGVSGFGSYNGYPQRFHENVFDYSDTLSITKGNHGMKVGASFRRNQENSEFNVGRPSYYFYNLLYVALDDPYYQAGGVDPHIVDGTRRGELKSNFRGWRSKELGIFFNDDWKVRPNLTFNLGIRYDIYSRHKEVQGRTTKFDMTKGATLFERVKNGVFDKADVLSEPDYNNFAPRLGFAWDPSNKGKMSLRGGVGVAFQSGVFNPLSNSRWNQPYYSFNQIIAGLPNNKILYGPQRGQAATATGPNTNPGAGTFEGSIIAYEPTNANNTLLTGIANPRMRDPYVFSYFLGLQRELFKDVTLEVNYVGTNGRKLIRAENWNRFSGDLTGACAPTGDFCGNNSRNRINSAFGVLRFWENSVTSSYNAMQVQVTKRFSHGYTLTGNYTLAKSLDIRSTWHSGATTSNGGQEGYSTDVSSIRLDHGRSIFDARHRAVVNYIWELPFFKGRGGAVESLLGGWELSGIVALQSGQPFTPYDSRSFGGGGDYNADGTANDRLNTPASGNTVKSERSSWVNPLAGPFGIAATSGSPNTAQKVAFFGAPSRPSVGKLGRNTFEGPGFANTDFSILKSFKLGFLGDQSKLQFRAEFFNIFNRVNFFQPTVTVSSSTFGRSTATFDAREIQFGLKLIF